MPLLSRHTHSRTVLDEELESSESLEAGIELVPASGQLRRIVVVNDDVAMPVLDA